MRGIHRSPVNSPHKGPVTRKMFPFDDVIMFHQFTVVMSCGNRQNEMRALHILFGATCWDELFSLFTHWWFPHWGQDNMAAISQTTLSNAFSWMKMLECRFKFHWTLFLRVQLTHYLNQWWLYYRRIYASLGLNELILSNRICTIKW